MAAGHGGARKGSGRKKKDLSTPASVTDPMPVSKIIAAVPDDALEAMMRSLPADVTAHQLLNAVLQSPHVPGPIRMHAAAKVLPFEVAKPSTSKEQGSGGIIFKLGRHGAT